ncbi:hypothetical protein GCM10007036_12510 [Alsobacter metallidurans]|uniref:Peptidoglycan binding-like domain-containing protein n=1 Tax=Alsobacter metallidurans TaxID=340221 RepID=A0A917MH08_9HYPH|nr:peptidoglycan-binding domain-containing protein [Alsobacter metallidurans]GGH13712.1 hypothetical protein GCM10007036_12510 [Alsobacter metallidurans]
MPEVLARTDHDFVLSQERRPRKARAKRKPSRASWFGALFRNPGVTAVGAAGAAIGVGIIVNALALQNAPHPAPLFGKGAADVVKVGAIPPVLPPSRPTDLGNSPTSTASVVAAESPRPQKASLSTPSATPQPIPRDAIGDMLRGGSSGVELNKGVLAAQKALNKLGYGPVKADGVMGSGTRQAVERFEQDRKLPQTGELNPRTAKALASASGIALD